jgi:Family of unknown function (DUF5984)
VALFPFTLDPVASISPWMHDGAPSLSWFALTHGRFWIDLGTEELFRYTPAILEKWQESDPHPDYQVAAFVRDLLQSAAPALTPLPAKLAALAADWRALVDVERRARNRFEEVPYRQPIVRNAPSSWAGSDPDRVRQPNAEY